MFDQAVTDFFKDDLSLYALPIYLIAIALEVLWSYRKGLGLYRRQDTLASLCMMVAAAVVEAAPRLLALAIMIQLHDIGPLRDVVVRQWWAWVLLFFLDDFSYYWLHRINHQVRLLWAGHVNHHSSQYFNFGTALRQGVGERIHKFLFWLWLPLLGFDPAMIITMISISLFYQFWIHTESVGHMPAWFEAVFNTPSHHRREDEPAIYGLTTNINSDNPLTVLSHEYLSIWRDCRRADRWVDRLGYLTHSPGWSHDGPDKRAGTLRREAGLE
jgi:sterol desaturase/sphingolipid hydroxylase (fatty acid hydroxylase superfamily)